VIDRAQQRLLLALGASALLHAWLVQTGDSAAGRRATLEGGVSMSVTLRVPQPERLQMEAGAWPRQAPQAPDTSHGVVAAAAHSTAVVAPLPAFAVAPPNTAAAENIPSAAATSDPTYYPARSLDVYPRAITALDLGPREHAGVVRATVFIDEAGAVNEVRAIEAGAADVEYAAREVLLRARFTPAGKDGRPVKAQLLVSLEYGAGGERK
jgi:hypothetical protein